LVFIIINNLKIFLKKSGNWYWPFKNPLDDLTAWITTFRDPTIKEK